MQGRLNIGGRQFEPVVWYKHACLRKLYALIAVVWLSSATGGFDGSMMNGLQSLSYWETYFNNPSPSTLGLMNAIVPAGNFAINFFVPYMVDGIGRKNTLIVGLLVLFVGIGLQTGATNMGMFIASRFIGGVGASMGTGPYLITELAHPQHRPTVTAIYNTTYYIGAIIAAWATYGTLFIQSEWAWRLPSLLQYVTPLIQFALIWFVPESPRYLINKDRPDEARAILAKYHGPASGPEFVQAEFDEIWQTAQLERQFGKRGWRELWSTKGNRHRFLICIALGIFANTAGNAILSYYLHQVLDSIGISSQRDQLRINGMLNIYNWIIALTMAFMLDRVGRRPLFLISVGGMLCTFVGWTAFSAVYAKTSDPGSAKGVLACIFIYQAFYDVAWSGLYQAYACEILPYPIRARGLAVVVLCAYAAVFFANYVNPVGLANAGVSIPTKYHYFRT
jgi:sugar porter (SP) family MFS transporter